MLTAAVVAACGRQVTPNPVGVGPIGTLPGQMGVAFDVAAPFNFSSYQYWVIFDTTGDGQTPSTQPFLNNWAGYSSGIEVSGSGGSTYAAAYQFVKNPSQPHARPAFVHIITTPQQLQYLFNQNGAGSEFTLIFDRNIFTSIANNPSQQPLARNWTYNAFTTQASTLNQLLILDSMGAGGGNPPQYVSPTLNTWQCLDNTYTALFSGQQLNPAAQITSIEIANNPSPAPSPTPSAVPCSGDSGDARHILSEITR
ncbi:MAG TPA: hypothetical protein VGF98_03950 [Candidatus Tumulicola sp.]